nr:PREDICTED: protein phosphatase 1 regulatory subunit 15B-like [Paralichthys olivaceus]
MTDDRCVSGGQSLVSPTRLWVTPADLNSKESSKLSLAEDWMRANPLCPELSGTKNPTAATADVFVLSQADDEGSDSNSKVNSDSDCLSKSWCQTVDSFCVREDSEETDAESVSLLNSFSCSSDPSNPLNPQFPLRIQGPDKASPSSSFGCKDKASTPTPSTSTSSSSMAKSCVSTKKVQFSEYVEVCFLSYEEDRRGPWLKAAFDRMRFKKRCQDIEMIIDYCLQPEHRSFIYSYLYGKDTSV